MNYQEALDELECNAIQWASNHKYNEKHNFYIDNEMCDEMLNHSKLLQQLIDEKLEQESRKDKLVVGSKWKCVANCYCESYGDALKIEKGEITQLQSYHNHILALNRGIMPTQQFLLCFKPLEEGQ